MAALSCSPTDDSPLGSPPGSEAQSSSATAVPGNVRVIIDANVLPAARRAGDFAGGGLARAATSDGKWDEFATDELIFRPRDSADLEQLMAAYGAKILRGPNEKGWYLLRADPTRSPVADLEPALQKAGMRGQLEISSEPAARLLALVARERERGRVVAPNLAVHGNEVLEHPDPSQPSGHKDAEKFWWMSEDDDLEAPGEQGLSIGVVHAWRYVNYAMSNPWVRPRLAVIDGGFDLSRTTGLPNGGNLDYTNDLNLKPDQFEVVGTLDIETSPFAGGSNLMDCSGSPCPWHGQKAFGIAAAVPANRYGVAGTSGGFAKPLIVRVSASVYAFGDAIMHAAKKNAAVISMSLTACNGASWFCDIPGGSVRDYLQDAVDFATDFNSLVVAAAGNEGVDISGGAPLPCDLNRVICVGSVGQDKRNVYNFGTPVDIWAPTGLLTTPTPNGNGGNTLSNFGGTSCSTPFVAGVVALMRVLDPTLRAEGVHTILRDTANASPDNSVPRGYVDAYRAVQAVKGNQPPVLGTPTPPHGSTHSYRHPISFAVEVTDPERSFQGNVEWSASPGGVLCTTRVCQRTVARGNKVVTVKATDAFGAQATRSFNISVVNSAPVPTIITPVTGTSFNAGQIVTFRGSGSDADQGPIMGAGLSWRSNLQGTLGTGGEINHPLNAGAHTVTLRATDELGALAETSIAVTVSATGGFPSAVISAPQNGAGLQVGQAITLVGSGSDPEDGPLTGSRLSWFSDRDGFLGNGTSLTRVLSGPAQACNPDFVTHTIRLVVTDSSGRRAEVSIKVHVGQVC